MATNEDYRKAMDATALVLRPTVQLVVVPLSQILNSWPFGPAVPAGPAFPSPVAVPLWFTPPPEALVEPAPPVPPEAATVERV